MAEPLLSEYQIAVLAISLISALVGSLIGVGRHLSRRNDAPQKARRRFYGSLYALLGGALVSAMLWPAHLHQTGTMLAVAAFLSALLGVGAGYLGSRDVDHAIEERALLRKISLCRVLNDKIRNRIRSHHHK